MFNKRIDKDQVTSDSFSLLHMNIRSLPKHLLEFQSYIKTLKLLFSIIGLTETWFNSSLSNLYTLEGYNSINNSRTIKKGGDVALFVKENIQFSIRKDLSIITDCLETLFIEINRNVLNSNKT